MKLTNIQAQREISKNMIISIFIYQTNTLPFYIFKAIFSKLIILGKDLFRKALIPPINTELLEFSIAAILRLSSYPAQVQQASYQFDNQKGFIKISKNLLISYLIVFFTFSSVAGLFLFNPFGWGEAQAAPWSSSHSGWQKRKQLTLTNNSGSTINANTPYQITVDTRTAGNPGDFQTDCDDLRIVYQPDSSTATELSRAYHLAQGATSCSDSAGTIITFPLQASISNNSSSTNYYLYYANPTAASPSNSALSSYNFSSKTATFVAPFTGTTTALAAGTTTPTTATGAIRYSGNKGSALSFNGFTDTVTAANTTSIQDLHSADFTVEGWFYITDTGVNANQALIRKTNGTTTGWQLAYSDSNRLISFQLFYTGTNPQCQSAVNSYTTHLDKWTHIAAVYNSTTKVPKLFFNGVEPSYTGGSCQTGVGTAVSDSASSLALSATTGTTLFGSMDEIRISNTLKYNSNFTPPKSSFTRDTNTKLLYHLDENGDDPRNTGKIIDDSGNANHGTITGAKYISGLMGVDNSNGSTPIGTGNSPIQSYAGHQGTFIEDATTNKITNPSFEHSTFSTNWAPDGTTNLTATENTTTPFYKFGAKSAKLVADADAISGNSNEYTTSINVGNTNTHMLTAYVYDGTTANIGGTVTASIAQLVYNGSAQTTTYANMGGGWWRLSYTAAGINGAADYGIEVDPSKTVYVDGVQLEEKGYATTYTDGSLGSNYSWSGTENDSTSTRTVADLRYDRANNIAAAAGSISLWVKTPWAGNDSVNHTLLDVDTSAGSLKLIKNSSNNLVLTDGTHNATKAVSWSADSWQHIVADWGSSNMHVYVNGVAGTAAGAFSAPTLSTSFYTGQDKTNAALANATISDLRIYDSVLSSTDVGDIYNVGLASYSQTTQEKDNPNLYWKLDEGQGTSTGNSGSAGSILAGTLNNTPTWQTENFCVLGKCLWFDGSSNESVSTQDNDNLDFGASDGFSIGAWVKRNGTSSAVNYILSKADATTGGYKIWMDADGDLCFGIDDDSSWGPDISACSTNANFDDDKWHYVTGVRDATSDTVKVYVDGLIKDSQTDPTSTTLANTNIFYVGVDRDGTSNEWLGFIDEVKVFPIILSEAQVKVQYNLGSGAVLGANTQNIPNALSYGLVGYWKMDESSGDASDSSGNSLTLTNNNTVAYTSGKFANTASYTAASSRYHSTATTISGVKTVSFWTNNASTTDDYINLTASAYITSSSGTISATGFTSPTIYVNGVKDGTLTASVWNHVTITTNTAINANAFEVGRANSNYNNGLIDDVRTYSRTLSGAEVSQLYNWAPGPIGYWKLDEQTGTTAYDSSGNGNDGTLTNTPTWTTGRYGGAVSFAGSNQHIIRADDSDFDFGTAASFSYQAWIKHNTASALQMIIDKYDATSGNGGFKLYMESDGDLTCGIDDDEASFPEDSATSTAATYDDNKWHHIACVKDGTTGLYLYIDGVLIASDTSISSTGDFSNADPLYIGIAEDGTSNDWVGQIDEPKIYNYNRTPAQVIEDMNAFHPAPGSPVGSPIGHWKFNEGAANTCSGGTNDACNSGNNTSTLDLAATGVSFTSSSSGYNNSGKFGKAITLDGSGDYFSDADSTASSITGDLSISAWVKFAAVSSEQTIIGKWDETTGTDDRSYRLYLTSGNKFAFSISSDGTSGNTTTLTGSNTTATTGTWYYVTAVYDKTNLKMDLYVNGKKDVTQGTGPSTIDDNTSILYVGGKENTAGSVDTTLNGTLDELKLYSGILTESQILLDMNDGKAQVLGALGTFSDTQPNAAANEYCPPDSSAAVCTEPVARWDFEEGTGNANDTSGNGNTATITAGASFGKGKIGKGLLMDGANNNVSAADSTTLNMGTSDFTLEAWVKGRSMANGDVIFSKTNGGSASSTYGFHFSVFDSLYPTLHFASGNVALTKIQGTQSLVDGIWYHIAIVVDRDSTTNTQVYINGAPVTTTVSNLSTNTGSITNTLTLAIGDESDGGFDWDGDLDQIRIFKTARTPAQIALDYNRGAPIAHWKIDECQGTTINDSSGNSFTGTLTNATAGTCTTSGAWFNGATGKRNYSLSLDGSDDYIQISDTENLRFDSSTQDFSLFAWVKRAANGTMNVISKEDADNDGYRLQFTSSNTVRCSVNSTDIDSTLTITDTNWHLIGCTINRSGNGQIYIDGQANGTAVATSSITMATTSVIRLGAISYTTGSTLNGQIDDTRIYNYILTPTQIKTLYNGGAARFAPVTGAP